LIEIGLERILVEASSTFYKVAANTCLRGHGRRAEYSSRNREKRELRFKNGNGSSRAGNDRRAGVRCEITVSHEYARLSARLSARGGFSRESFV